MTFESLTLTPFCMEILDNNPVFEYEEKSEILQETFFSGNHLSENDFLNC